MTDQLRALEQEFAEDPDNRDLFNTLSEELWQARDWRTLCHLYEEVERATDHSPDFATLAERLGEHADKLDNGPEKGQLLLTLGDLCLKRLDKHDEGMNAYQKAFKAHPEDVTPLRRARSVYEERGDWEHLLMICKIELRVAGDPEEKFAVLRDIAQIQGDRIGDFAQALEVLDEISALGVEAPFAEQLRTLYENEISVEEAILLCLERAEEALNDGPAEDVTAAFIEAAQLEYDRYGGSAEEALSLASQALQVDPENEDAQLIVEVLSEEVAASGPVPVNGERGAAVPVPDEAPQDEPVEAAEEQEEEIEEDQPRTVKGFYQKQGDFGGDVEAARAALEKDRADVVALKAVRGHLLDEGDMAQLVEVLENSVRYLRKRDGEWEVMTELANLYWLELGDDEKAEYYFKRLKLLDPEHPDVFKFYEAYYESEGEWRKLFTLMAGRLEFVEDKEEYRIIAERLSEIAEGELGSPEKAIDVWKTFSRNFPEDEEARKRLRHLYEDHGKWNALVDLLKEEVREMSEVGEDTVDGRVALLEEMAHIYRAHLNLDTMVMNIMAEILELDPDHPSAFAQLRDLYESNRRFNDLAGLLADAAERAAQSGDIGMAVGNLLEVAEIWEDRLNNQTQALPYLERIVEIAPEEVSVRDRLREIYEKRRDFKSLFDLRLQEARLLGGDEAAQELEELLELSRERLRDPEREANVLRQLVQREPENLELLEDLQRCYKRLEDWESMARTLEKRAEVLTDEDESLKALTSAAELNQEKLENLDEAARIWTLVLAGRPEDETAFAALGAIFVDRFEYDKLQDLFVEARRNSEFYDLLGELAVTHEENAADLQRRRATLAEKELEDPQRVIEALQALRDVADDGDAIRRELLPWYRIEESTEEEIFAREELLESEEDQEAAFEQMLIIADLEEKQEQPDAALAWVLKAFSLRPDDADVLARAEELAKLTSMVEALVQTAMDVAEGLESEEVRESIWEVCARLRWQELQAYDEAIKWYETLRERYPERMNYLEALEALYDATDRAQDRITILKEQIDILDSQGAIDADRVDPLGKIADVQRTHLGEKDAARETYAQILDLQPEHLGAIRGLKELHREEEQWMDVVDYLLREIPLAGYESPQEQWRAKMELAELYRHRLDDTPEALRYYGQILGENPEYELALEAVRDLLAEDELAREASMLLEPIFRDQRQYAPLAEALEARHRVCDDPFEEQEILDELIPLYADELEDIETAFKHARRQFEIDPERDDIWLRFEQLGARLNKWELIEEMFTRESPLEGHESPTRYDLLRHLAAIREHQLQKTEEALQAWKRLHEFDPLDLPVLEALERLYRKTEDTDGLVPVLRSRARLVDLDDDRIELLAEAGRLLKEELDDSVEAVDVFREVLGLDPEHEEAVSTLETLFREQERWHDLDSLLSEQVEQTIQPDRRRQFLKKLAVLRHENLDDLSGSVAILCDLLEDDPGDDDVLDFARQVDGALSEDEGQLQLRLDLARTLEPIYRMRGEYDRLDEVLQVRLEAGASDFERIEILDELVELRQKRLGNPEGALEALSAAVLAQPDDEDRRRRLLELANGIGRLEEGAQALEDAAHAADPFVAFAIWKRLGRLASHKLDDPGRAIDYYEQARELDEADKEVLEALERLFEATNQSDRLCENLNQQVRFAEPDRRMTLLRRVATLYDHVLEEPVDAMEAYRQILEMEPEDLPSIEALERIYRKREQFFDLTELLRRKVDIVEAGAPKRAVLQEWATVAEEDLDDLEQTIGIYRRILEDEPAHPRALAELDRLLQAQAHWPEWTEVARRRLEGPASADPDVRLDLQLRLARVLAQELFEVGQALELYRDVLDRKKHQEDALQALEELAQQEAWLDEVAADLDRIYREQQRWQELIDLYERRRQQAMDPTVQADLYFESGQFLRDRLESPDDALRAFTEAWKLQIDEGRFRKALMDLAAREEAWELLVELLGEVLDMVVDPDLAQELRLTLAGLWQDVLGDPVEAEVHLRDVFTSNLLNDEAFGSLFELLEHQQRWHDLVEIMEQRHQAVLGEDEARAIELLMSVAAIQSGNLEDGFGAVETLQRVRALDDHHKGAIEEVERLLREQERWEDLALFYEDRAAGSTLPSEVLAAELALAELCQGPLDQVPRAIELYGRALEIDAEHRQAIDALEAIFAESDEYRSEAARLLEPLYRSRQDIDSLARVLEARADGADDPADRLRWLNELSHLLYDFLDKPAWAWSVAARLFADDPGDEAVRERLWRLTARAHAWEELAEIYEDTLTENFDIDDALRGRLHCDRARLFADRIEDLSRGREAAEKALQMSPDSREAIDLVECILERQNAWADLADFYRNRADFAADEGLSRHWYEKLAALNEDVIDDVDATVDIYARLLELAPGDEDYRSAMERILGSVGRWYDLADIYRQRIAGALDPEVVTANRFSLAQLLESELSSPEEAVDLYRQILEEDQSHSEVVRALEGMRRDLASREGEWDEMRRQIIGLLLDAYREERAWRRIDDLYDEQIELTQEPALRVEVLVDKAQLVLRSTDDPIEKVHALTNLAQAYSLDPTNEEIHELIEVLAHDLDAWERVVPIYLRALGKTDDVDKQGHILTAIAQIYEGPIGDLESAIAAYQQSVEISVESEIALEKLQELYGEMEKWEPLVAILERRLEAEFDADAQRSLRKRIARIYDEILGQHSEAIRIYEEIRREDPGELSHLVVLERLYEVVEDYQSLEELLVDKIQLVDAEALRARIFKRLGEIRRDHLDRVDDSIASFHDALAITPDDEEILEALMALYRQQERWPDLLDIVRNRRDQAEDVDGINEFEVQMGDILLEEMDDAHAAFEHYRTALERDRHNYTARGALFRLLGNDEVRRQAAQVLTDVHREEEEWDELEALYERLIELTVDDPQYCAEQYLALAEMQENVFDLQIKAFATLGRAMRDVAEIAAVREKLEELAHALESSEDLVAIYEEALESGIDDPEVSRSLHLVVGQGYAEALQAFDEAIPHFEAVLAMDEYDVEALSWLDKIYQANRDWENLTRILEVKLAVVTGDDELRTRFQLGYLREVVYENLTEAYELYRHVLLDMPGHSDAIKGLERLCEDLDLRADILELLEPTYRDNGDWLKLVRLYSLKLDSVEAAPDRAMLYRQIAEIQHDQLEDIPEAFSAWCNALRFDPHDGEVQQKLEAICEEESRYPVLVNLYEEICQDLSDPIRKLELAEKAGIWAMEVLGDSALAAGLYRQVLDVEPEHEQALEILEKIAREQGDDKSLEAVLSARVKSTFDPEVQIPLVTELASVRLSLADYEGAVESFQQLMLLSGETLERLETLAHLYEVTEKWAERVDILERLLNHRDDEDFRFETQRQIGFICLEKLEEYGRSRRALEDALTIEADNPDILRALEDVYQGQEDWEAFTELLERKLAQTEDEAETLRLLVRRAEVRYEAYNDVDGAIVDYQAAFAICDDHPDIIAALGRLYRSESRWDDLIDLLTAQVNQSEDPAASVGYLLEMAAVAHEELNALDRAAQFAMSVLEYDAHNGDALDRLETVQRSRQDWNAVVAVIDRRIERADEEERTRLLMERGRTLRDDAQALDAAAETYQLLLQESPDDEGLLSTLKEIYDELGDGEGLYGLLRHRAGRTEDTDKKAELFVEMGELARTHLGGGARRIEALEAARSLRGDDDLDIVEPLLDAYIEGERFDLAAPLLESVIASLTEARKMKDVVRFYHLQGKLAEQQGDVDGARKAYDEAHRLDATYVPNLLSLGKLSFRAGDWDHAKKIFQILLLHQMNIKRSEDKVEVYYYLGAVREQEGDERGARDMFKRALRVDANHEDSKAALAALDA